MTTMPANGPGTGVLCSPFPPLVMSFLQRSLHPFLHEWRRLYLYCLGWWAALIVMGWHERMNLTDYTANLWRDPMQAVVMLGAMMLSIAVVAADAPFVSDTGSLTRPIGRGAMWLGKFGFLFASICIPWLIKDMTVAQGFGYDGRHWVTLMGSSLLLSGLLVSVSAALACLPHAKWQYAGIFILTAALASLWFVGGAGFFERLFHKLYALSPAKLDDGRMECGSAVATALAVGVTLTAWWAGTLWGSRKVAVGLMLVAMLQWPVIRAVWPINWMERPELVYGRKEKLELLLGQQGPLNEAPGGNLWRRLRVKNLEGTESVNVKAIGPVSANGKMEVKFTDYRPHYSSFFTDQMRFLERQHPTAFWTDQTNNSRSALYEWIQPNELRRQKRPWRLDLAVFQLVKVAEVPLAEVLSEKGCKIALRPGVQLSFQFNQEYGISNKFIEGEMRTRRASFQPEMAHTPTIPASGRDQVIAVYHYAPANECHVSPVSRMDGVSEVGVGWMVDSASQVNLALPVPKTRMLITGLRFEDWVKEVKVSFWMQKERGTTSFEVPFEPLAQAAETSKWLAER